jgi:hypothetical protein
MLLVRRESDVMDIKQPEECEPHSIHRETLIIAVHRSHLLPRIPSQCQGNVRSRMPVGSIVESDMRNLAIHASETHLLELDNVRMNQSPVVHNLSFHILGDLRESQPRSACVSAWPSLSTDLVSPLNELDCNITVIQLVLAELDEAKGAAVEVLDFLVLGMSLQRLLACF